MKNQKVKIKVKSYDELKALVEECILLNGNECDLNHLDISDVKSLAFIFRASTFNGDISRWDTSNIEDMTSLFESSSFNGDISSWNTSKVKYMSRMFMAARFNGDISKWDVSSAQAMNGMFHYSNFSGDLVNWEPYSLIDDGLMFLKSRVESPPYWSLGQPVDVRADDIRSYVGKMRIYEELSSADANGSRDAYLLENKIKHKV